MSTTLRTCLLLYFKGINNPGASAEIKTKQIKLRTIYTQNFSAWGEGRNETTTSAKAPGLCLALNRALLCLSWGTRLAARGSGFAPASSRGDVGSFLPTRASHLLSPCPLVWGHGPWPAAATCNSRAVLGTSRLPLAGPGDGTLGFVLLASPESSSLCCSHSLVCFPSQCNIDLIRGKQTVINRGVIWSNPRSAGSERSIPCPSGSV